MQWMPARSHASTGRIRDGMTSNHSAALAVSLNNLIIRASALALQHYPHLNACFVNDSITVPGKSISA